jgi:hypothetical protein
MDREHGAQHTAGAIRHAPQSSAVTGFGCFSGRYYCQLTLEQLSVYVSYMIAFDQDVMKSGVYRAKAISNSPFLG